MSKTAVPVNGLSAACPLCGATRFTAHTSRPMPEEVVVCDGCRGRYTYGFLLHRNPPSRTRPAEELLQEIARAAYFRAQGRGFAPGFEEQDWREAEATVLKRRDGGAKEIGL